MTLCRAEGGMFVLSFQKNHNNHEGDHLMKRFLGVLVASMFLASAAYAADGMKDEKTKSEKSEKGEKGEKRAKKRRQGKRRKQRGAKGEKGPAKRPKAEGRREVNPRSSVCPSKVALPTLLVSFPLPVLAILNLPKFHSLSAKARLILISDDSPAWAGVEPPVNFSARAIVYLMSI